MTELAQEHIEITSEPIDLMKWIAELITENTRLECELDEATASSADMTFTDQ